MSRSIIPGGEERACWICKQLGRETTMNLQKHHCIYGRGRRKAAEHYGLHVKLCWAHHEGPAEGVHGRNTEWKEILQKEAQKAFEKEKGTREDFIRIFWKSYL